MTTYVHVNADGDVDNLRLPTTGTLPDGRHVSRFDLLPAETLAEAGWLPLEDTGPPDHDPDTHHATAALEVDGDRVRRVWTVEEHPPAPAPSAEEAEAAEAEEDAAAADAELAAMLGKLAAGTLTSTDRSKIPDLAVRALGGRAKAEQLRGRQA